MLSIVICSVNTAFLRDVTENIRGTVGVEFELLVWDNREAKLGLSEVYNRMAEQARYPFICFLHEDILFTTPDWGKVLIQLFKDRPGAGVAGVAGGKYKSLFYSGWYTGQPGLDGQNITHRINGRDEKLRLPAGGTEDELRVVCVDGVLICCTREIWQEVRFDPVTLKGFHFYDIDFSLRASFRCEVWVTLKIDLIHITQGGDYGDRWVKEAIHYHEVRKDLLPAYVEEDIDPSMVSSLERKTAAAWLDWLKVQKISLRLKIKWVMSQGLYRMPSLWYPIFKFFFYRRLSVLWNKNR
jgi:hypothetical protein